MATAERIVSRFVCSSNNKRAPRSQRVLNQRWQLKNEIHDWRFLNTASLEQITVALVLKSTCHVSTHNGERATYRFLHYLKLFIILVPRAGKKEVSSFNIYHGKQLDSCHMIHITKALEIKIGCFHLWIPTPWLSGWYHWIAADGQPFSILTCDDCSVLPSLFPE